MNISQILHGTHTHTKKNKQTKTIVDLKFKLNWVSRILFDKSSNHIPRQPEPNNCFTQRDKGPDSSCQLETALKGHPSFRAPLAVN